MSIITNAAKLNALYAKRAALIVKAAGKTANNIAQRAEKLQIENLSGGKRSRRVGGGGMPVPQVTNNLRQSTFSRKAGPTSAVVGNKASYARDVHDGIGANERHGKRPFLQKAVDKAKSDVALLAAIRAALQ